MGGHELDPSWEKNLARTKLSGAFWLQASAYSEQDFLQESTESHTSFLLPCSLSVQWLGRSQSSSSSKALLLGRIAHDMSFQFLKCLVSDSFDILQIIYSLEWTRSHDRLGRLFSDARKSD